MVKSVRLICILLASLLLSVTFVVPHSYAADGDHSTNADTVNIWLKERISFRNKDYYEQKEAYEKQGESIKKIYVEDSVATGKFVGYCFDLGKHFPAPEGHNSTSFQKRLPLRIFLAKRSMDAHLAFKVRNLTRLSLKLSGTDTEKPRQVP
ncbi:Uncharacterised protein [Corynebacterium diphtheriae]|nr:hypothetical protein CIP107542_02283 [Corynebacterium diphtheriae]CAB1014598.1 hypothetical protein FRC0490_02285 [Corynebacterium diphtheriae]CAB1052180.1 hypothetical protein NCTC11397BIS_02109 [Corynebacterium diphtheriae]CKH16912.1 Uncharacterised protein [Corynebacterium diphtheriae]